MKSLENNFDNPDVNELLIKHFNELKSVSPDDSCHVLNIEGLIGCGALKFLTTTHGEFKSIRVEDKYRGKNLGKKIISYLINQAKTEGIKKLSIETGAGDFFEPARKLFKTFNFKTCEPFANYKNDPNSCYFDLEI